MAEAKVTTEMLVDTFLMMRAVLGAERKVWEAREEKIKKDMRRVENELLRRAQEQGVEGFKSSKGTTYIAEDTKLSISSEEDFFAFCLKTGDLDFFERRPSLRHVMEYQKNNEGRMPPGLRAFRENRMRVRASKKKGQVDLDDDSED